MIRNTIDLYLSCIDRRKVHLVFQLWLVSFLTAFVDVSLTASGYEPWDIPTYVVVWLAVFVTLEGLATAGAAFFSFWIVKRRLPQMARQVAGHSASEEGAPWVPRTAPHASDWDDLDAFWDDLPDGEGVSHD